jgi:hypothetical protein
MSQSELELIQQGEEFILRRTTEMGTSRFILSEDDVLTLAQSAEELRQHIVAKHTPVGAQGHPVVATPAPQAALNYDALHGDILLDLIQPNGRKHHFALPLGTAKALHERLGRWIAEASAALTKKSSH